jgi:predicted DNA-binding protein
MARPRKPETLKKVQVRLSDDTKRRLELESKKSGMNVSQIIRTILEKHFDNVSVLG